MRHPPCVTALLRPMLLAGVAVAMLAGCATRYEAAGPNGGYSETQLDRNVFRVTFRANVRARQADADDMALLRSAQVALQHGFPYFTSSGAAATGTALSIATNVVSVPASTITIVGYPARPETTAIVYDANAIAGRLGPKYIKPEPAAGSIPPPLPMNVPPPNTMPSDPGPSAPLPLPPVVPTPAGSATS